MSKVVVKFLTCFVFGLILIVAGGCEEFASEDSFETIAVPRKKVRQIETLELEEVKEPAEKEIEVIEKAPEDMKLSIEKVRAIALEHNLGLQAQLIAPSIAERQVDVEQAKFEWAFTADAYFNKTDTPTATLLEGSQAEAYDTRLGVNMPLRTGGTLRFSAVDDYVKTNNTFSTLNPSYSNDFLVSISQPLLRNAGQRVNTHSIRLAKYDKVIADARTKLEVIRVLAAADRVYWRLYAARRELKLRQREYELAQAQLERSKRFVEAGEKPQVEVIRAQAGVAQRLEAIIVAENSVRQRQRELKRTLNMPGLDVTSRTRIEIETLPDPVRYEMERERLVQAGLDNRMELLELELQLAKDASTVDFLKNQTLPLATLDYTYNINGLGANREDSLDLLYDKRFEDHRLGVQVLIPLGNEAAKNRLLQGYYQRIQRLATRDSREQLVEQEVLNSVDNVEATWQRIMAARQNAMLAGRLYEAEQRQFELGLRTNTDVLEAQASLADAKSAEIQALAEYQISLVDLAFATGTLPGAAKVEWGPIKPMQETAAAGE
ncbi:outer membrane channel protein [Anaerohalosphaera lusitana]|uniref:Outer membrane channel protein n=1 Tax=Anaerohalosphaera lusitana TaxID=1936003 RepID=A0A1U9NP72_9BACT|nr:TolC family protein [Anaerohalosphaera lusitana]AQT69713.1 outer membrane channel protein [Anaerohalosphaera lusitana]